MKIIGGATGLGAQDPASGKGPYIVKENLSEKLLKDYKKTIETQKILNVNSLTVDEKIKILTPFFNELTIEIKELLNNKEFPLVIGGDHSCAIGSWRGLLESTDKDVGLMWIDAHLDSHTFNTTPSKAIHGMPLACLLGYGENDFIPNKVLKPENVVVFGARSWEHGEKELLDFLNVRIYEMDEISQRGIKVCFEEAGKIISKSHLDFGFSLDLDVFDPLDIPAVCSKEKNGLSPNEFLNVFKNSNLLKSVNFKMAEIVEFAPDEDVDNKTLNCLLELVNIIKNHK